MTRPVPAHGTEGRYQGAKDRPGCRCRTCITGWTRAGQLREIARLAGRPASIPAQPVSDHIAFLRAAGMSTCDIAAASGIDTSTIVSHAARNHATIHRTTAAKILAVRPGVHTWRVPAIGTRRRIQALYAIGYGSTTIAADTGMTTTGIDKILNGRVEAVSVHTRAAVATAYKQLINRPGTSTRARNRAAANGWPGPLAWDDIDNPNEQPETADTNTVPRYLALAEDAEWLERTQGYSREHAAARLGVTRDNLQASISRARKKLETAA